MVSKADKVEKQPMFLSTAGYESNAIAYAMMKSGLFVKCECSLMNDNPMAFDDEHISPRDTYVGNAVTEKDIGEYADFIKAFGGSRNGIKLPLHCVCALNENDTARISFISTGATEGIVSFTGDVDRQRAGKLFKRLCELCVSISNGE